LGFSFVQTFVVAWLNPAFVLIMYGLWLNVRLSGRVSGSEFRGGEFKDAVTMVVYGIDIGN
jgi:hypothetical protein